MKRVGVLTGMAVAALLALAPGAATAVPLASPVAPSQIAADTADLATDMQTLQRQKFKGGNRNANRNRGNAGRQNANRNRGNNNRQNANRNNNNRNNANRNRQNSRNFNNNRNRNVNRNVNVNVRVNARPIRPWVRRPYFGTVVGGVALGTIIAASVVPVAPAANLCWYWTDSRRNRGYWDRCF